MKRQPKREDKTHKRIGVLFADFSPLVLATKFVDLAVSWGGRAVLEIDLDGVAKAAMFVGSGKESKEAARIQDSPYFVGPYIIGDNRKGFRDQIAGDIKEHWRLIRRGA